MKSKILNVAYIAIVLFVILPILALGAMYLIPPNQEVIKYHQSNDNSDFQLDGKVGWYKSTVGSKYQITWGAKTGLKLNYFDSLRTNLKSIQLNFIEDGLFDTDENLETAEAEFTWNTNDSTWVLDINTSKTKLKLVKQDHLYYHQKEVEYYNDSLRLVGLLLSPYQNSRSIAVIFIHGSGVSDRDNFWYMYQANYLAQKGITVLLPDKRGCGKSLGKWHTASFNDFANDTKAGLQFLKRSFPNELNKMGIIGLSQGGWISHIVAQKYNAIDFVVDVVSSATTPREQLKHEIKNDIKGKWMPGFLVNPLANVFAKRARKKRKIWWDKNGDFDPIPLMKETNIPILKIIAANDENENVPIKRTVERIDRLIEEDPDLLLTLKIFEQSGHGLFDSKTNWIRNDYLDYILEWIQ